MHKVLVVDDEAQMRHALYAVLKRKGFDVTTIESGALALAELGKAPYDAVVTDVRMPKMTGLELLRSVKGLYPALPVIMMTAYGTIEDAIDAMRQGAEDYILKPFSSEVIERILTKALTTSQNEEDFGIITKNPKLLELLAVAKNVAPTQATVLITGESGTGKELLARFIHASSDRAGKAFVSINCASIPDGLLESELFGHEKGAFTGAEKKHIGKFEQADGGTLLLDEVGDMGIMLQTKLLRVLQEREVDRVGGKEPVKVDIRIIATTNRDLKSDVSTGIFREDLYYRLNVFPFHLPPLCERPEDVEHLSSHFLKKFVTRYGREINEINSAAMDALKRNPWKGNIRELENVMERAVLLCNGDTLKLEHLYYGEKEQTGYGESLKVVGTIREMEKELIFKALKETDGNKTKAAGKLGISVRTLRNKLKEYSEDGETIS